MAQWGQQPGYQYPMQTGFPGGNPQFHQIPQFQQQTSQLQPQNVQFQQGTGGLLPQRTGFPGPGMQVLQPQQTGFPGSGFLQAQPTGFPGTGMGMMQQQHRPAPPPPVPPIPSQFQQQNQNPSFLSQPPQNSRFLSPSPSMGGSTLARPLVPQATGYVDPRLNLMSSTFMPINTSSPYSATGAPQLPSQQLQGGLNLQQSFQQHNQGSAPPRIPWALSKAEKKSYDSIFRAWDPQSTGFISGQTALEVFGQSGLSKDDLARIWTLADVDDRGKLNIAEFHVAMGLIYRKLNGNQIPDTLPPELIPPSARDLGGSVDILKDLLKNETRSRSPGNLDAPVSRLKDRSFHSSSSMDSSRDATIYKHSDEGSAYTPRNRHVDRNTVRSSNDKGAAGDLAEMRNMLDSTSRMLDKVAEEEAYKTAEDEALEREMEDLRYRIKRLTEDLEYASRGPRTASKDEDKRRFERELLSLRHEKLPELERRIKARDERKEREKRQWQRDRDRANERSGRYYDDREDRYSSRGYDDRDRPYSRGAYDDRDGSYSRGGYDDRDRPYSRGAYDDRERPYSRGPYNDRNDDYRRSSPRDERDLERSHSPVHARSPPPPPPAATSSIRDPPPASRATQSPAPAKKNMTAAERQAEVQRRIEARKVALGLVATPSATPVDTSVEDRLQKDKKEAEEKARAAEKEAEERENTRKERLERERALKEGSDAPASPPPKATPPAPAPPAPKAAPPAPKPRAPPPPKPRNAPRAPPAPAVPPEPAAPAPPPVVPVVSEPDPEEEAFRAREEALRKQREARAARLKALEEEEDRARIEEEKYQAKLQALKNKPSPSPASVAEAPPAPPAPPAPIRPSVPPATAPPFAADKSSTNPFSRLINQGGDASPSAPLTASTNPWSNPIAASPAVAVAAPARTPSLTTPAKSPTPTKTPYNTAPQDDDDWDVIEEKDDDDDSSDDDIAASREVRDNIAIKLFGNLLPRPQSAAGTGSVPNSPVPAGSGPASPAPPPPPPPRPPVAPVAPPPPAALPAPIFSRGASSGPGDRSALFSSIQSGMKLRPTKTVDKSGPQMSGRVLGESAPPEHIIAVARPPSSPPPLFGPLPATSEPPSMSTNSNRQSVDWYAGLAADVGSTATPVERLPSTLEEDEKSEPEVVHKPEPVLDNVPSIQVDTAADPSSDLMADIDKSIQLRVRSLYPFEGDSADDLSFGENLILAAHPSKTGGDWWHGTLVSTGKSGLFPKTYVQEITPIKAKAVYTYTGENPDELSMAEGNEITIIDRSEDAWWKAEQDGVVYIVPAAYLEIVEDSMHAKVVISGNVKDELLVGHLADEDAATISLESSVEDETHSENEKDGDSNSDFPSFDSDTDSDEGEPESEADHKAREHERQMVLEAAGLIVKNDAKPPLRPRKKSRRRPPPAAPQRQSISSIGSSKDLPPVPDADTQDHATRLNDAYDRYETFRLTQASNINRLSVASTDTGPSSPIVTATLSKDGDGRSYSNILHFLGRKTPVESEKRTLNISGPILNPSEAPGRPSSPAFGSSWASLVDKMALEGIPSNERRRQEAIFELIATETAYVRDLQLVVEVFYSDLLPLLDRKAITVIFANIEDILLTNITFMSSLEERQKDCRLYIDRIGDILQTYMSNMGVYMEYCVNQSNAIKVLQSLRDSNLELAAHLQLIRDGPSARSLDLSSYLLIPMQRITRYPLLIRQILHYTESEEEKSSIEQSLQTAEKILNHINETIRVQEGQETLRNISQHLWVGQGRLDLTAPTRYMGARALLKEGLLMKAKSGRKLHAYLCSDILVLTDDKVRNLYRMPIALSEAQVRELPGGKDELAFQVALPYPRGGEAIGLRATSARDCQVWMQAIESASRRCKDAERCASRKVQQGSR